MRIGFKRFDEDWVLPVDGTQGNKSRNLFLHRDAARAAGFKRAKAVVVPWEYLKAVQNPAGFVLSTIDEWLPGWKRVFVRSDAPDEDNGQRIPGLYSTETIWHMDRDYAPELISRVIESYDTIWARRSRKMRNVSETGMGLLLERAVNDVNGNLADCVGTYTNCDGLAKILFADPREGHKAMIRPPFKDCLVNNGVIESTEVFQEERFDFYSGKYVKCGNEIVERIIAQRLSSLVMSLPKQEGRGWEIEFLAWLSDSYVAQITPIVNHPPVKVPDLESAFDVKEVVGTGDFTLDGILAVPILGAHDLHGFDATHSNYTVLTTFTALSVLDGSGARDVLSLLNARAFLIANALYESHHISLAPHVEQYLRNTGVALWISFPGMEHPNFAAYSPTPHGIVADEASGKAVVLLKEPLRPFEPI